VGGNDLDVLQMNHAARSEMRAEAKLVVIPGASHLFEEPGALEDVAELARDWFEKYL
jgi:dipeptidyl aminopeptidase/acylaminoacyl peptidase